MNSVSLIFKIAREQILSLSKECKNLNHLKLLIKRRYKGEVFDDIFEMLDLIPLVFYYHCLEGNVEEVKKIIKLSELAEDLSSPHEVSPGVFVRTPRGYLFDFSHENNRCILIASENGYEEIVSLLLDRITKKDDTINILLKEECRNGHYENVKKILTFSNINPSYDRNFSLISSMTSDMRIFKMLLDHPLTEPQIQNNYLFKHTTSCEALKLLLDDPRVDPNVDNNYAVKNLCFSDKDIEAFKILINNPRVEVNFIDEKRGCLLAIAISCANVAAFNEIIKCNRIIPMLDQKIIYNTFEIDAYKKCTKFTEMILNEHKLDLLILAYDMYYILFDFFIGYVDTQDQRIMILEILLKDERLNKRLKNFKNYKQYKSVYPRVVKRLIEDARIKKCLNKKDLNNLNKELKKLDSPPMKKNRVLSMSM